MEISQNNREDSRSKKLEAAAYCAANGQEDKAYALFSELLGKNFDDVHSIYGLARLYMQAEHYGLAYNLYRVAAGFKKLGPGPWNGMGLCHAETWDLDAALSLFRRALAIDPNDKHALGNCGLIHLLKCEPQKALQFCELALRIDPQMEEVVHHKTYAKLMLGQWKEGWEGHRRILGKVKTRADRQYENRGRMLPYWDGSPGKTVLVFGEQGIGDEISFSSCLPDLEKVSKRVILDCDHRLEALFRNSFPNIKVHGTRFKNPLEWIDDYEIDARVAIGDLPSFFRNSDAEFPGTPYLKVDPKEIDGLKPRIGIAWTGGLPNTGSVKRSLTLKDLEPILTAIPATWVSLEYKDRNDEIQAQSVEILQPETARSKDYAETAALIGGLDLVICVTTAVVHAAGAIGKEAWVLVPSRPRWWYGIEGDKSHWYKSVQFFRQKGSWAEPIQQIAKLLKLRYG